MVTAVVVLADAVLAGVVISGVVMAGADARVLVRDATRPAALRTLSSRLSAIVVDQIGNRPRRDSTAGLAAAGAFIQAPATLRSSATSASASTASR